MSDSVPREIVLERERCVALVRELTAAPPGSRRTVASRNLAARVDLCVRAILVGDETATCVRGVVREAEERARVAEGTARKATEQANQAAQLLRDATAELVPLRVAAREYLLALRDAAAARAAYTRAPPGRMGQAAEAMTEADQRVARALDVLDRVTTKE